MSFTYKEKHINSIYVDKIWRTYTTSAGVYMANLDGNWDIIISKKEGAVTVTINGIGKHAVKVPYTAGVESIGIALKAGVFLQDLKGKEIVNRQYVLQTNEDVYVKLGGQLFKIPVFETAEIFIDTLVMSGVLLINPVVAAFNSGKINVSGRSLRRHIAQTTGLSPHFFHQIQRAQHATQLLQQGIPIATAAVKAGYTDQAHMTKAVKLLMGRTPGQIAVSQKK